MEKKLVGKITHYFPKVGVAVVEVEGTIKLGDTIMIEGQQSFEQKVTSMQIDLKSVKEAKKGQSIGLKVDQPTQKGLVYKI